MRIDIQLPPGRMTDGVVTLLDEDRPPATFRCLGRSDQFAATAHGNPARDPLRPFGDVPTGEFDAVETVPALPATPDNIRSYGRGNRFVLNGITGAAAVAIRNGRFGLLIHGGATGHPMPPNALRPTHGCIRVDDGTITAIMNLARPEGAWFRFPVTVREVETFEPPAEVAARYGITVDAGISG